jgi:hypothetical protein
LHIQANTTRSGGNANRNTSARIHAFEAMPKKRMANLVILRGARDRNPRDSAGGIVHAATARKRARLNLPSRTGAELLEDAKSIASRSEAVSAMTTAAAVAIERDLLT